MSPWATLGIKRTEDAAAIRRAYAGKLKTTDVDANPAAFIALRAAFERALGDAEASRMRRAARVAEAPDPAAPEAAIAASPPAAESPPLPEPAPPPEPIETQAAAEPDMAAGEHDDARYIALDALLFAEEGAPPPDPDALAAAVRAILDHPDMDHVDRGANIELWLAETLCHAIPRSDSVIPMVIEHFHWDRKAGHWDQPWMFDELVKRRNAFRLLDQLAFRSHPLHAAWRDLTSDKPTIGLTPLGRRSDVESLLYKIRAEAPPAEAYLNPHRVAIWEGLVGDTGGGGGGLGWIWIAFIALVALARLASSINGPSTHAPSGQLRSYVEPALYLDPIIREASGRQLGIADVAAHNRILHQRLLARWEEARAVNDQTYALDADLRAIVDRTERETLRGGSSDLQAAFWRLAADRLKWLHARDPAACVRSIEGGSAPNLPAGFDRRRLEIMARALAEEPPADSPPALARGVRRSYPVPGAIFAAAARDAGLSRDAMDAAINGRGTAAERCRARIALIEAAIAARGAQGRQLLRDMSAFL